MILTRAELIAKLGAVGIPMAPMQYLAPDEVGADKLGSFKDEFFSRSFAGFIALLQSDPNAALTTQRPIGNSGATITVPRYISPGFVCRHAAFAYFGYLMLCLAKQAAVTPQENDGYAVAVVYYTATPRAEDGNREGRHARMLYIRDDGSVGEFEEGDGDPEPMTPGELASISFVVFA